jgi:hypothetical protein
MYIANPRRLLGFLVLLLLVLAALWFAFLRGGSAATPGLPVTTPHIIAAPDRVAQVLNATAAQPRIIITQSGVGPKLVLSIDRSHSLIAATEGGKLVNLQQGNNTWSNAGADCYLRNTNSITVPTQVSELGSEYLPVGRSGLNYTYPRAGEVEWTIPGSAANHLKAQHGVVVFDPQTHMLRSATVFLGTGALIHAVFTYPARIRSYATPTRICKSLHPSLPARVASKSQAKKG